VADTKISALSAASVAAVANELAINEAGTSKKISITQLVTLLQTLGMPVVKQLGTLQQTTSTVMAKVTGLDQVLGVGTWVFDYRVQWRTTNTATAIALAVNHTGTAARFLVEATGFEATTAASTGAQTAIHAAFGLRAGGQNNVKSASTVIFGPITAAVADADLLVCVRGLIAVTASGNLELYFAADATNSGTQSIEAMSSLVCVRTA
jgi:hypothetical protein